MICGSGLAKAAGAEPSGQMRDEKLHAIVARSTYRSQNVQNTTCSDDFWKLRCRKSALRCGAKHSSKSKWTKHTTFRPLLEVEMSKQCTPLWRKAHVEVKSAKSEGYGALLDVQMPFCVAGARDCAPCQKLAKREGFVAFSTTTTITLHYTSLHYTTEKKTLLNYTTLHCTTLHHTTQHYTTLTSTTTATATTIHSITLHYTTLHYNYATLIALHYTTLHYTTPHYTTLHHTTLHYTTLPYITLHYATLITPPQMQLQLHYTNYTTPQLPTPPHYNYNYSCTTPHYQVTTATIATTPKTQLQPPFGPSVDSLCHPWFTTTNLSCRLPIF